MAETEASVEASPAAADPRPEPPLSDASIAEVSNGAMRDDSADGPGTPAPATPKKQTILEASPAAAVEEPEKDESPGAVALFDLDHTVLDTNSSWHWVQHEVNNGKVGFGMLMTALYWFSRYALGRAREPNERARRLPSSTPGRWKMT